MGVEGGGMLVCPNSKLICLTKVRNTNARTEVDSTACNEGRIEGRV